MIVIFKRTSIFVFASSRSNIVHLLFFTLNFFMFSGFTSLTLFFITIILIIFIQLFYLIITFIFINWFLYIFILSWVSFIKKQIIFLFYTFVSFHLIFFQISFLFQFQIFFTDIASIIFFISTFVLYLMMIMLNAAIIIVIKILSFQYHFYQFSSQCCNLGIFTIKLYWILLQHSNISDETCLTCIVVIL